MSKPITNSDILVAVDGSAESDAAVRWATSEAMMRNAMVTLVHVIPPVVVSFPLGPMHATVTGWQEDNARHVIERAVKTLHAAAGEAEPPLVHTEVWYSTVVKALIDASKDAGMVVVGSRGLGGLSALVLGSVSSGLIQHAHCPVVVVKADEAEGPDPTSPVVLGIDGSPASEAATAVAFDEASRRGVQLVALHAWSDVAVFPILGMDSRTYEDQGHEVLAERLAGWQEQYPDVHIVRRIECDRPAHWLIDASQQAQLVVLGSHGRGGFPGALLGSVSEAVAQAAKAPVVVVRAS
jgi:nucleotide-binding universal stress UspA family protein